MLPRFDARMNALASRHRLWVAGVLAALLFVVGLWALDLQARQARDTRRKLDLEDLETALNRLLTQTGTLPPANQSTWCGVLNLDKHRDVRAVVERALRETKKYAKAEKPFPADPRFQGTDQDYAYWKTSPVSFELLAHLEADDNNSRSLDLTRCELATDGGGPEVHRRLGAGGYDYAIVSFLRSPP